MAKVAMLTNSSDDAAVQQRFASAFEGYLKALQRAGVPPDAQRRAEHAYDEYLRALEDAWTSEGIRQRAEDAYNSYMQVLRETLELDSVQRRFAEAYGKFLQEIQAAWSDIDVGTLDANTLGGIAQSILTVAWLKGAGDRAIADLPSAADNDA